jgi:hypothetical protein
MAQSGIKRGRNATDPQWIFRWRGNDGGTLPRLFSFLIVAAGFVFLLTFVRVRTGAPQPWIGQKASIIHLRNDADGRAWAVRAEEGGPFPSHFDPSDWAGYAALKHQVIEATRISPPAYVPPLRELPSEKPVGPLALAPGGVAVFPHRSSPEIDVQPPRPSRPVPVLYPLSKIPIEALPSDLPVFDAAIDREITAKTWRFLLRLRPDGGIADCVSLAGAANPASLLLEDWLRKIRFDPALAAKNRWISIAVGFINQSENGPDDR